MGLKLPTPNTTLKPTTNQPTKNPILLYFQISESMSLDERFEALMRNFEELRSQNGYMKKQLATFMSNQRRNLSSIPSSIPSESNQEDEEEVSNLFASSNVKEHVKLRRNHRAFNHFKDFKVKISEFEGC